MQTEDGNGNEAHVTSRYQSTDVRRAIKSVYETAQAGNIAIFYNDGGEFVNVGEKNMNKARDILHQLFPGNRRIPFSVKNRQYILQGTHAPWQPSAEDLGICPVDFKL